jgi:hypothetical protein
MNKGTTDNVYEKPVSYISVPAEASAGFQPRRIARPKNPTRPIANAIGTRITVSANIASSPSNASVTAGLADGPSGAGQEAAPGAPAWS